MSHKKSLKRSRSSLTEVSASSSPSTEYVVLKRSKLEEHTEEPTSVRRSSRAPKPKLFDDEYLDINRSSIDESEARGKKEKALVGQEERRSSDNFILESDAVRRSSRVPKPKLYDEDFVDSPKARTELKANEKESVKKTADEVRPVSDYGGASLHDQHHSTKDNKKEKRKSKKYLDEKSENSIGNNTPADEKIKSGIKKDIKLNFSIDSLLHGNPINKTDYSTASRGSDVHVPGGSPKVRQSSRTPVPKKIFSLIEESSFTVKQDDCSISEESEIDIEEISSQKSSHKSKKHKLSVSSPPVHTSIHASSPKVDVPLLSPLEHGKKKGKSTLHAEEKSKKKSKKVKSDSGMLEASEILSESISSVPAFQSSFEEHKKDKSKRNSTKTSAFDMGFEEKHSLAGPKEDSLFVSEEKTQAKKKSKKKTSQKGESQSFVPDTNIKQSPATLAKEHSKHTSGEHSKRTHSKHSKTKHEKPHSETKDQDQHIILKLHLPHSEGSSHHTHTHKKHKHKHHSSESKSESSLADSKSKKRKMSPTNEDTHKKKVSIKFKGLSSNKPGVEVEVDRTTSPFPPSVIEKGAKEPEIKTKKSKKKTDDIGAQATVVPPKDQEHLKVVIKKKKKEAKLIKSENENDDKSQVKESKTKPKETKSANIEELNNTTKPKASPKKKSKTSDTPSKSPKDKEKRKIVTGYLLFCKKERSIIAEANPGLEFVEISKKVGVAWNSLSEKEKQKWREKANNVKAKLGVDKKEEKKPEPLKSSPEVVDMAAHLKLLGESLSLIGVGLMAQKETEVHGSLSVLLDSILCAICPLTFLTSHIPGIPGINKDKQAEILDDLAYTMPGLG